MVIKYVGLYYLLTFAGLLTLCFFVSLGPIQMCFLASEFTPARVSALFAWIARFVLLAVV